MDLDVDRIDRAEDEIDRYIERRSQDRSEQEKLEKFWRESEDRKRQELAAQRLAEWRAYYSRLSSAHEDLSRHFQRKANEVISGNSTKI